MAAAFMSGSTSPQPLEAQLSADSSTSTSTGGGSYFSPPSTAPPGSSKGLMEEQFSSSARWVPPPELDVHQQQASYDPSLVGGPPAHGSSSRIYIPPPSQQQQAYYPNPYNLPPLPQDDLGTYVDLSLSDEGPPIASGSGGPGLAVPPPRPLKRKSNGNLRGASFAIPNMEPRQQAAMPSMGAVGLGMDGSVPMARTGSADSADDPDGKNERRKINIEYIEKTDKRHITFSKRKAGIMKKAYELSTLTGTQVLLLVVSDSGRVYTYTTDKFKPLVEEPEGQRMIAACLEARDGEKPDLAAMTREWESSGGSGAGSSRGGGEGSYRQPGQQQQRQSSSSSGVRRMSGKGRPPPLSLQTQQLYGAHPHSLLTPSSMADDSSPTFAYNAGPPSPSKASPYPHPSAQPQGYPGTYGMYARAGAEGDIPSYSSNPSGGAPMSGQGPNNWGMPTPLPSPAGGYEVASGGRGGMKGPPPEYYRQDQGQYMPPASFAEQAYYRQQGPPPQHQAQETYYPDPVGMGQQHQHQQLQHQREHSHQHHARQQQQ